MHQDVERQKAIQKHDGTTPKSKSTSTPKSHLPTPVKKTRLSESFPDTEATTPSLDVPAGANRIGVINRPEAVVRCYDVLGMPRAAKANKTRKACTTQAVQKHLNKPASDKHAHHSRDEAVQLRLDSSAASGKQISLPHIETLMSPQRTK